MRTARLLFFIHVFSSLVIQIATAQQGQPWTLRQCIDHAFKYNMNIRQYLLYSESAHEDLIQSQVSQLPSLNSNASHLYNYGRTVDPFTNEFATEQVLSQQFSLSSDATLFSGFQKRHAVRQSRYSYQASRHDVERVRNDITLAITAAYLEILLAGEIRDIAEKAVLLSQQQVEATRRLVDAGSQPRNALLDMEAQLATDELQLVGSQNQLDLAYLDLALLLDLDSSGEFRIVKPEIILPETPELPAASGAIYEIATGLQPSVKSAELNLAAALEGLSAARAQRSPRLFMSGSIGTGYSDARRQLVEATPSGLDTIGYTTTLVPVWTPRFDYLYETTPFNDQVNDNLNQSFGFHLSIPLFNGWQVKTAIRKAEIRLTIARLELERQKQQLNKDIQRAFADALAAMKKYGAGEKALDARKTALEYAQGKFEVGMITTLEFNDAKNKLAKAESDLIQAKYEYLFKIKVLEFYMGKPIDL